jgi:predicted amino acid-binding ACT domain protein
MRDVVVQATASWGHITLDPWSELPDVPSPAGRQTVDEPSCELAVLSVNGPNRVGFEAGISNWLYQHDIDIESGHSGLLPSTCGLPFMAYGTQYMLSAKPAGMERLRQMLRTDKLPVPDESGIPVVENDTGPPVHWQLTIFAGNDKGILILARVSRLLAKNGVDITAQLCQTISAFGVETTARKEATRGSGLFRIHMDVEVPRANYREIVKRVRKGLNFFRSEYGLSVKFDESLTTARLMRAVSGIAGCDI